MSNDAVSRFAAKFASLAGIVHRVESPSAIVPIIEEILSTSAADCVALAELPAALSLCATSLSQRADLTLFSPPYPNELTIANIDKAQVGITFAPFAIADTGTLVEVTTNDAARLVSSLPRTHICLVMADSILSSLHDAAPRLREAFAVHAGGCTVTFLSGPSRTGDIEMKLTLGVHGPETAHAIIVDRGEETA